MDPSYSESKTRRKHGGLRKRITYPLYYQDPDPWTFGGSVNLPPIHRKLIHPRSREEQLPDLIRRKEVPEDRGSHELSLSSKISSISIHDNFDDRCSSSSNETVSCTVKPIHCWLNKEEPFARSWPLSSPSSGGTQALKLPKLVNCGEPRRGRHKTKQKMRMEEENPKPLHLGSKPRSRSKRSHHHLHRRQRDDPDGVTLSFESDSSKCLNWLQRHHDDVDDDDVIISKDGVILPHLLLS